MENKNQEKVNYVKAKENELDTIFHERGWAVADMIKNFMNNVVIPLIDEPVKKDDTRTRKPRIGEIVGCERGGSEAQERYGVYAGDGYIIAIPSDPGEYTRVMKITREEFFKGYETFFVIDIEEFQDEIGIDNELSANLNSRGIKLEFNTNEISYRRAESLSGFQIFERDKLAMFTMALWCKVGVTERETALYLKNLVSEHKISLNSPDEDDDNQ